MEQEKRAGGREKTGQCEGSDFAPVITTGIGLASTITGCGSASECSSCSEDSRADSMDLLPDEASKVTDFLSKSAAVRGATTSSVLEACSLTGRLCRT